jgi:DNA invertase Pin-like site-specific DNA recombinase
VRKIEKTESTGKRIGYLRISPLYPEEWHFEQVMPDQVFMEPATGHDMEHSAWDALLKQVESGDTVIAPSMDRLARNLTELRQRIQLLAQRGISIEFLQEHVLFPGDDPPRTHRLLTAMEAVVTFERMVRRERQREGIVRAKQRGVYRGRPTRLTLEQIGEIQRRVAAGETKAQIARELGLSRETIYHYLRLQRSPGS